MVPTRWRRAILASTLLLLPAVPSRGATATPEACREGTDVAIWTSPRRPAAGAPLRVLAVADAEPASELAIVDSSGRAIESEIARLDGPPWSLGATIASAQAGTYRIEVRRGGREVACRTVAVGNANLSSDRGLDGSSIGWDRRTEAFYSAWIERLFDAP